MEKEVQKMTSQERSMRLEKAAEKYGLMESQIKQVLKVYPQAHPEEIAEMLAYFGA